MLAFNKRTKILLAVLGALLISVLAFLLFRAKLQTPPKPAVTVKVESFSSIMDRAQTLFKQNRLNESQEIYQKALITNPNHAGLHNDLGFILLEKNLLIESEKHLAQAIELDPACAECNNNLGILKTLQGKSTEAEQLLKLAMTLNEKYPEPYYNLAVLYEKNGDIGNAISSYEDFLKHSDNKNSLDALQVQNRILMLRGKP